MNFSNFTVPPPFSHIPPGAPVGAPLADSCHCPALVIPSDLSCVKYAWPQKMITVAFAGAVFGMVVGAVILHVLKPLQPIQKLRKFSFMKTVPEDIREVEAV